MRIGTIFAAVAIPATAFGLLAQDSGPVIRSFSDRGGGGEVMVAQASGGVMGMAVAEPGNFRFLTQEFSFSGRTVTNAPYSAEEKTESVQTLADGNRIVNTTTAKVYRDSQGRVRRELTLPGFGGDQPHTIVTINDPVAKTSITLDSNTRIAHEMPGMPEARFRADAVRSDAEAKMKAEVLTRSAQSSSAATFIRRAPAPDVKREDLGANVMEGVSVTGSRETSTIEAGAMGNEKPITITSERWYSPDLQVEVKSVHNDPRMGQTTHTVTNIVRAEPDASLFQVPADYNKMEIGKPGPAHVEHFEYHTNQ